MSSRNFRPCLAAAVLALHFAGAAHAGEVTDTDRFQLWNGCVPVSIAVSEPGADAARIGVTRAKIEAAVRSRLDTASIYASAPSRAGPWLDVFVGVDGAGFLIVFDQYKVVTDLFTSIQRPAITWRFRKWGRHGNSEERVVGEVAAIADGFVAAYLRANGDTCGR